MICYGVEDFREVVICIGVVLDKFKVNYLFFDFEVFFILGEYVIIDLGMGCVYIVFVYGVDDFNVGKQYDIEVYNFVGNNGVYLENILLFVGKFVFKVNDEIIEMVKEKGNFVFNVKYEYSYLYCWCYKMFIIFCVMFQWFISMDKKGL